MTTDVFSSALVIYKLIVSLSILIYFAFDFFERRRVQDEREEFIHLKSLELVQKVNLFCVTVVTLIYLFTSTMPAFVPIMVVVLSSMYTEIFGKIWYRRRY